MKKPIESEYDALRSVGFISGIDFLYGGVLSALAVYTAIRCVVDNSWLNKALPVAVIAVAVMFVWIVTLLYRGMYFVIKLRAAIEVMPEQAGRIAAQLHLQGIATSLGTDSDVPRS